VPLFSTLALKGFRRLSSPQHRAPHEENTKTNYLKIGKLNFFSLELFSFTPFSLLLCAHIIKFSFFFSSKRASERQRSKRGGATEDNCVYLDPEILFLFHKEEKKRQKEEEED
jgi:hypothetical protein